ncbi:hypothetical protein SMICM304S_06014 [Streptomyces microflavus]
MLPLPTRPVSMSMSMPSKLYFFRIGTTVAMNRSATALELRLIPAVAPPIDMRVVRPEALAWHISAGVATLTVLSMLFAHRTVPSERMTGKAALMTLYPCWVIRESVIGIERVAGAHRWRGGTARDAQPRRPAYGDATLAGRDSTRAFRWCDLANTPSNTVRRRGPAPGGRPRSRRSRPPPRVPCRAGPWPVPPPPRPVVPAWDLGGHAADGVGAALVAGADQEFGVGAQEGGGHGDGGPVGEDEVGAVREVLDQAEEVVPAARVEAGAVFAQLVEDLLHLERGGDRLDEDGGTDRAAGDVQQLLGEEEDVVPEAGLVPVLQLGQVEVRSTAGVELPPGAVEEVEAEVDQGGGNGPFVDDEVLLREMPAPGPDHDGGGPVGEPVLLAGLAGEVDAPVDGVDQGQLALDDVLPGGEGSIL